MASVPRKPIIDEYTVDPYSARALILLLEMHYNLTIRVYEHKKFVHICIDMEEKKEYEQPDRPEQ